MIDVPKLTDAECAKFYTELQNQPSFRKRADREYDYYDGKQLDTEVLTTMAELGLAPIIENIIAPTIDSVLGLEVKNRLDFVIKPEDDDAFDEVASAVNHKVNEAERRSKADSNCSKAFADQVISGLGWVFVGNEDDPFKYPHKTESVSRNEIFWDMKAKEPDLSDARFLMRRRWYDVDQLKLAFPDSTELLMHTGGNWSSLSSQLLLVDGGGMSTGLSQDFERERSWTTLEQEWRETSSNRLCLSEIWYRRWVTGKVLRTADGRAVEFDEQNQAHIAALDDQRAAIKETTFSKTRLSWWVGPHCLGDVENPYAHGRIPYVPFFGKREDMTGIPYGLIRPMIPMQDEINARNTKMIWLLAAKRVTLTEGVADIEETRAEAARPDAVHVLNHSKMASGGVFKVETDFALNQQQYQVLQDKRSAIKNVAGVYAAFEGRANSLSGVAADSMMQQTSQTLAVIYANQRAARIAVGELLMANVIAEIGNKEMTVKLKDSSGSAPRSITLNQQHEQGVNNDIERAMLRLSLTDIPATASYRQQQSGQFAEVIKSLPPQMQAQLMDIYLSTTDMPNKEKAIERISKMIGTQDGALDPQVQQAQQQIQQLQQQLQQAQQQLQDKQTEFSLESRKLDIEERGMQMRVRNDTEAHLLKREQSIPQATPEPAEMSDAQEVDAIVAQVTAQLAPTLTSIQALLADLSKRVSLEDATEAKEEPQEQSLVAPAA